MTSSPRPSGLEIDGFSDAVRPQDDLFAYVNQPWHDSHPIPADRASFGSFEMLRDDSERAIRAIVEEATLAEPASEARKFGDLYTSFLDEERIEARGAEPLRDRLALVETVSDGADALRVMASLQRAGFAGLYHLFVDNDPGQPERYLVFFEQGGISLPDESYYRDERYSSIREAYLAHVTRMLELAGLSDAPARAARVLALETEIAARHWDTVASRDSEKTYNLLTWADAAALFSGAGASRSSASLEQWLGALDAPSRAFDEVVVRQPSFLDGLAALLDDAHLEAWRDWLRWRIVHAEAPYLASGFVAEHFDFYGRTLTGAPEQRERWKRGVSLVEAAMGEAVGRTYVERHFPPAAKAQMDVLVEHLVEAYRQSISSLAWMGEATRQRAIEKLDAFTPKIGYPPKWRDYGALVVDAGDLIANVRAASAFELERELAKIGTPLDRDEWFMTPQTVNAYYNPGLNEIVFPAAILQWPFFDPTRDDAANYGAIGAIIGHEIGHGFDDQGSKFDGAGRLRDWWEESDRSAFEERTRALIDQYDALHPREVPDQHVNGALTIGENIGDLGGLGIAWRAYVISLNGAPAPVVDGLSGAQRFFLAWAQAWRYQVRAEEMVRRLAIDPHSPAQFRCNQIVRNIDEFYDAFAVAPTDALWLDPAERVTIW